MEGMDCESVNGKILKFNEELAARIVHLEKIDDSSLRMKTWDGYQELYEAYQIILNVFKG